MAKNRLFVYAKFFLALSALAVASFYIFFVFWYVSIPKFLDHAEASVVTATLKYLGGGELYHAVDVQSASIYSMVYGPLTFLANSLFLSLNENVLIAGKLSGAVFALVGLIAFFAAVLKRYGAWAATIFSAHSIVIYLAFSNYSFWNRPDPGMIVLCSLASAFFMLAPNHRFLPLVIFSLAALAANFKITGFLYFVPFSMAVIRYDKRILALSLIVFFAVFLAPYWDSNISLQNNFELLLLFSNHGFTLNIFSFNILSYFLFIAVPAALYFLFGSRQLPKNLLYHSAVLISTALLISFVSGRPGSGPHHLMPLVTVHWAYCARYFVATDYSRISLAKMAWPAFYVLFVLVSIGTKIATTMQDFEKLDETSKRELKELNFILGEYGKNISLGFGEHFRRERFSKSYYTPFVIQKGGITYIDLSTSAGFAGAGQQPGASFLRRLQRCDPHYWIIPSNETPFLMKTGYTNEYIFSDEFRKGFSEYYRLDRRMTEYDVWRCRNL